MSDNLLSDDALSPRPPCAEPPRLRCACAPRSRTPPLRPRPFAAPLLTPQPVRPPRRAAHRALRQRAGGDAAGAKAESPRRRTVKTPTRKKRGSYADTLPREARAALAQR